MLAPFTIVHCLFWLWMTVVIHFTAKILYSKPFSVPTQLPVTSCVGRLQQVAVCMITTFSLKMPRGWQTQKITIQLRVQDNSWPLAISFSVQFSTMATQFDPRLHQIVRRASYIYFSETSSQPNLNSYFEHCSWDKSQCPLVLSYSLVIPDKFTHTTVAAVITEVGWGNPYSHSKSLKGA